MGRIDDPVNARGHLPILVLVLLVDGGHQSGGRRQQLVDEDEDGLVGGQLDALADDVDELADGQVGGDQVLLLVDGGDVAFLDLLADDLSGCECISRLFFPGGCLWWLVLMEAVARRSQRGSDSAEVLRARDLGTMVMFGMPLSGSGLTGMRSRYFWRIRSASALRFSKGCSSLNLERMEGILSGVVDSVGNGGVRDDKMRCGMMRVPLRLLLVAPSVCKAQKDQNGTWDLGGSNGD